MFKILATFAGLITALSAARKDDFSLRFQSFTSLDSKEGDVLRPNSPIIFFPVNEQNILNTQHSEVRLNHKERRLLQKEAKAQTRKESSKQQRTAEVQTWPKAPVPKAPVPVPVAPVPVPKAPVPVPVAHVPVPKAPVPVPVAPVPVPKAPVPVPVAPVPVPKAPVPVPVPVHVPVPKAPVPVPVAPVPVPKAPVPVPVHAPVPKAVPVPVPVAPVPAPKAPVPVPVPVHVPVPKAVPVPVPVAPVPAPQAPAPYEATPTPTPVCTLFQGFSCPVAIQTNQWNNQYSDKKFSYVPTANRYKISVNGQLIIEVTKTDIHTLQCADVHKATLDAVMGVAQANSIVQDLANKLDGKICFVGQDFGTDTPICSYTCP